MSKARGLADLGNAFEDGALSNRNIITNGEFLVSQRGDYTSSTVMTDNVYTVDRWKTYRGAGSATFQDMGGSLKLTASSAYTGTLSIRQHVEWVNLKTRVGQTFTLSAYMKTTSSNARLLTYNGSGWSTGSTPHSGSGNWEIVTFTFTMPDASSYGSLLVAVGIDGVDSANVSIANGENIEIKQVQLEVGDTATPFEHRSYGDELARCQRYFQTLMAKDGDYHAQTMWVTNTPADSLSMALMFPHEMRAAPTATRFGNEVNTSGGSVGTSTWAVYANNGWRGCYTLIASTLTPTSCRIDTRTNDGCTAGGAAGLYGGQDCYWAMDAEL